MNNCTFSGRIGQIEIKQLPSGDSVLNMSLAIDNGYKNKAGDKVDKTAWLECKAFAKTADTMAKWLKKGDGVMIVAKAEQENWIDKSTGSNRSKLVFNIQSFDFMLKNKDEGQQPAPEAYGVPNSEQKAKEQEQEEGGDLPF